VVKLGVWVLSDGRAKRTGGGAGTVAIVPISSSRPPAAGRSDAIGNEFDTDDAECEAVLAMCTDAEGDELLLTTGFSDDTTAMQTDD